MKGLFARIGTAIVAIVVVVGLIAFAPRIVLVLFVSIIASLLAYEIAGLFFPGRKSDIWIFAIPNFFLALIFLITPKVLLYQWMLVLGAVLLWFVLLSTLGFSAWKNSRLLGFFRFVATSIVCLLSLIAGVLVHDRIGTGGLLYVIALVSVVDSGAFFVGKAIGKHKFAPTISPNKTWEGTIGGVVAGYLLCAIVSVVDVEMQNLQNVWLLTTLLIPIGIVGDLFESSLKRAAHLSDSGNMLPGHGGLFDRLDSVLPVLPMTLFYSTYIH